MAPEVEPTTTLLEAPHGHGHPEGRDHLLQLHGHDPRDGPGLREGPGERGRRGADPQGARAGAARGDRRERGLGAARRGDEGRPRGHGRRRAVGRRRRVRHADPLRQRHRAAQAVHRHPRPAVGAGPARRQGLLRVHLDLDRPRRPGVDAARALQHDPPLRRHPRDPGLHRPDPVHDREPLRPVARRRPGLDPDLGRHAPGDAVRRPARRDRHPADRRRAPRGQRGLASEPGSGEGHRSPLYPAEGALRAVPERAVSRASGTRAARRRRR